MLKARAAAVVQSEHYLCRPPLLRLPLALASGLTLRHPLLDFFLGAAKYDPSYVEIIFHW